MSPIKLQAVIPRSDQTWQQAKKHQARNIQYYLGYLRNGRKNYVIIDMERGVLEMDDRFYPMSRTLDGSFLVHQHNMTVKLNGLSGQLIPR